MYCPSTFNGSHFDVTLTGLGKIKWNVQTVISGNIDESACLFFPFWFISMLQINQSFKLR